MRLHCRLRARIEPMSNSSLNNCAVTTLLFSLTSSRWSTHGEWTSTNFSTSSKSQTFESGSSFLPFQLDDSEVAGLRPTVGYVDGRRLNVDQLVNLVPQKLGRLSDAHQDPEP